MFKIYQKYLIGIYTQKFIAITIIFFFLIYILGILEEISFSKNTNSDLYMPYLLTLLNSPITLFEIFPFIFLITTQLLFYDVFQKNELVLLKRNGLSNFKIIKVLIIISFMIGIFNVFIYYNIASNLKYIYSDLKNNLSSDNRYLAMVNENGLWIKDEINNKILITKANKVNDNYILGVIINEFNKDYDLARTIQSDKVDINSSTWKITNSTIIKDNVTSKISEDIFINTNFDDDKIKSIFSDIVTLDLIKLYNLKKDYDKLGYSSNEIELQIYKLYSMPFTYAIFSLLSSIIMLNFNRNTNFITLVLSGILLSVVMYYMFFIFNSLGNNGTIPVIVSAFFPIVIIFIISLIGLVNINEK